MEDKKQDLTSSKQVEDGGSIQGEVDSYNESKLGWWKKFKKIIEVDSSKDVNGSSSYLYNYDLRPVEKARRLWSWYNYVFFWVADSFNINTWQIASTGVATGGMTWWQTWVSVWLGYFLCGVFVSIGSRVGIAYHISFPVAARSSFGIYGSLWPIINRVVMAAVWYAVQCAVGGPCFEIMLRAIFGKNLNETIPNHIHDSSAPDFTSFKFLSLFLFWLFSMPFLWLPPHKLRHLFTIKAYIAPPAGVAFLIWTLVKAHGIGPVVHQKSKVHGSDLAWAFIESTVNSLANFATLIVNAPDFSRFSKRDSFGMKYLVYTISIPVCFSLTALIGILVSSASTVLYNETYWSPLDVLQRFLDEYSPKNRAGAFFIAFAFALAQLGTNISANSLSFGTDVTALLPKYMTIRRGGYICALLTLPICPWKLMSSSNKFTTYLSAYAVFLSSVAGVVACDYFYLRRGYLKLTHLYSMKAPEDPSSPSIYKFNKFGINWRAYVAYICGIVPNMTGFVGNTGTHKVPIGATELYRLNFIVGFLSSSITYAILSYMFPVEGSPNTKPFEKGWFEESADVEDFELELQGIQTAEIESVRYSLGSSSKPHVV